jgi:outer membrane lipoprotein-sorting protein
MKNIITLFALCFITLFALAQMPKETVDTKAKAILDELSKKTKSYTSIKAEFSIVVADAAGKPIENQSGALQVKGSKYKVDFKGQNIFCDAKTQWTYIKESNEVQINNAPDPNKTDNINPANIFTIYEKGFKYKYEKEEMLNGAKVDVITLIPLEPGKKSYHQVQLFIDKVKKQIMMVKIKAKDQKVTTITVKAMNTNQEITDNTFVFNKADYKGVEEVDLRE